MKTKGIDLSHYQTDLGRVDFDAVRNSGVTFAMIRAGWCGYEGEMHFDANLERTLLDAAAAGVHTGLYVYSYAQSIEAARRAAQETVQLAGGYRIDYPIAFDVEDAKLVSALTPRQITDTVAAFCAEVRRLDYWPMFYTYLAFTRQYLDMERLQEYSFWVAEYASENHYEGEYGIWQYSGSGSCPGVSGKCDLDYGYRDYPRLIAEAGLNHLTPGDVDPRPEPEPAPAPKPEPAPVPEPDPKPEPEPEQPSGGLWQRLRRWVAKTLAWLERLFR